MGAEEDHRALEPQVAHARHGDQQLAVEEPGARVLHAPEDGRDAAAMTSEPVRARPRPPASVPGLLLVSPPGPGAKVAPHAPAPRRPRPRSRRPHRRPSPRSRRRAVASVDLLAGWREPDGSRVAALEIVLAPGWHTYWRVPGAAGIPPRFDWSGSDNLASVAYEWPRPEVFERYGLRATASTTPWYCRCGSTRTTRRRRSTSRSTLDFGVCDDICVPAAAELAARLAPDAPEEGRARIEAALAERPLSAAEAGVAGGDLRPRAERPDGYELTAEVTFAAAPAPSTVAVLEPGQPGLWIGEPREPHRRPHRHRPRPGRSRRRRRTGARARRAAADAARRRPRHRHPRLRSPRRGRRAVATRRPGAGAPAGRAGRGRPAPAAGRPAAAPATAVAPAA